MAGRRRVAFGALSVAVCVVLMALPSLRDPIFQRSSAAGDAVALLKVIETLAGTDIEGCCFSR